MYEQYSVYWVDLNPTKGGEMNKVRPCVILSPTEANKYFLTVISAPITNTDLGLPTRCKIKVKNVTGFVALDQMRALDKTRFCDKAGSLRDAEIQIIKSIIKEYLVD
ncbi:type II toxin-antitoxin system PemK/MazF family toxin [Sporomusa termitida]|uniref:Endoribonuclease MazF n=1 Tax=Sporomusa termitida TaxID=2377 RepID=A0A517DX60_9FIRM|nr:type II toxin-antitoxin system PemK/MazF family toxin [Sporomusa termitida]QDR81944.1 Endoribonuclease MazF [Sporomusa termitida]